MQGATKMHDNNKTDTYLQTKTANWYTSKISQTVSTVIKQEQ